MPLISVLLPVYRAHPDHFALSVASVMLNAGDDLELVVGFDGPPGSLFQSLTELILTNAVIPSRVLILPRQGLVATLNAMIDSTDSRYIARQDADDFSLPLRFSRQSHALDSDLANGFCGTQICRCDSSLKPWTQQRRYPTSLRAQLAYSTLLNNPIAHPSLMLRRSALDGIRYRDVPGAEDWRLYVELWQRGVRSFNLASTELLYRTHPAQITAKQRNGMIIQQLQRDSFSASVRFGLSQGLEIPHQVSQALRLSERLLAFRGRWRQWFTHAR